MTPNNDALQHHVSGAIARGEGEGILEIPSLEIASERAASLGSEHGAAAGTWVIDGNTSTETILAILAMDEEGDPALWDALPSCPLSGEWADSYLPADLASDTGCSEDRDGFDSVADAYENAWHDAMHAEVIRSAHANII